MLATGREDREVRCGLQRMVEAFSRWCLPPISTSCQIEASTAQESYILVKKGVAGIVNTPAKKSLDHPLPPVAEAE